MCPFSHLYRTPQTLYESAIFFDTSAFIELQLQNTDALDCKKQIEFYTLPTFTTAFVIAETYRKLLYDHGKALAFSFLSDILSSNMTIIRHNKPEYVVAQDLIRQYWDFGFTFCDAVSFAVMLKMGIFKSFTYDFSHFQAVGFVTYPPFYP